MATAFPMSEYREPSYQTVPLEEYSRGFQVIAHRLFQRVRDIIGTRQPKPYPGSYSIQASSRPATAAKILIYETGRGKTNGNWPDLQDGVYALIRANGDIGDRIWNEFIPPRPAALGHATRQETIGVAPRHSKQFSYVRVSDENIEAVSKSWLVAMYYFGNDGHKVEVQFSCSKGTCFFQQMRQERISIYDDPAPAPYEYYQTNDGNGHLAPAVDQVEELPCLAGRK
jgi:hypothetical protein